ncbi:MAG: hydrogenase maturation nickel metallochaperone HypA [Nocardioidaceae bacterium]
MHELAITQSVVDAVLERTGDRKVTTVRLKVGRLSGVVPDAMRFCFDLITAGTAARRCRPRDRGTGRRGILPDVW